ncbi:hypothetical protein BKA65DRAFT_487332 [Rhexocercosporidium sp. MPI-PUGE-AT-0058]|nr:hypothetical protein BKA65DRAFT_487332 [Rhexocercosporidium sp. MPI-PUGE-AT-0058]
MPRPKKAASKRGNLQASRGADRKPVDTSFVPFSGTSAPKKGHAFTLHEEARNTERHPSFWNTDQRLRDSRVSFVSAGRIVPIEPEDTEAALAEMTLESPKASGGEKNADEDQEQEHEEIKDEAGEDEVEEQSTPEEPAHSPIETPVDADTFDFVVDTHGSGPIQTGMPPPKFRSASPTPSNSSEEVILFRGRGRDQQARSVSKPSQPSRKIPENIDAKIRIVEDKIHEQTELLQEVIAETRTSVPQASLKRVEKADFEPILPQRSNGRGRGRRGGRRCKNKTTEKLEEDAMIADYIANMDEEDPTFRSFNQRDLGGIEEEIWQNTEASSGEATMEPTRADQGGWNRSDIEDFDDLGTSDGVMGEVQAILSKRERASGTQYLVVWEDQSIDEARWVPVTTLTSVVALTFIETFEAEEKLVAEFQDNEEEDTSDSDDHLEIDVEVEEDEDEEDLIQRKIDGMTDERIARLLSKQEELGMGSNEILLFDEDEDDDADAGFTRSSFRASKSTNAKSSRGLQRAKGDFPSATLLADAYDGFDVMDFDRPSLKKKPKGRKGKLVLDISDSELEASMQAAWDNDREKKKERKQEREELRAQGLLGSKNGKVDMKQKYKEGMGIYAVKEEIKNFLMGGNTTLSLPPMDKADRKVVHELANAFNLKSKSAGNGDNRFPILYRTSRTLAFNDGAFAKVDARISRRFLPRMDVGGKRAGGGAKRAAGTGGFNRAAVSYRDGDIVGGSAPELGADNRGRAMLEKMGWSSGTALGALNNKGIMLPVSHVVKTTKAGLG